MKLFLLRAAALLLALAPCLSAQSLYGISGGGAAIPTVIEFTGPPAGPCLYPNGPVIGGFPTIAPFPCPVVGPFAPPPAILGDVALDKKADLIYATDGVVVTAYTPAGVPVKSFIVPFLGPLTSLGFDTAGGLLWLSDGALIAAIAPPPPGCGGPFVVGVPPFPTPSPVPVTDVDWDPITGTLWVCSGVGTISQVLVGGGLGAAGTFPVAPAPCPLGPVLQGIAVDVASGPIVIGGPKLYVTDGFAVKYLFPPGGLAAPTFYTTAPCFPVPGPPINGLAYSSHGITYGAGFNPLPGPVPVMASTGNSTTPGTMAVILTAAAPGSTAFWIFDVAPLCPAVKFKGNPLYCLPTFLVGPFPVPIIGGVTLPLAIPPGLPPGLGVYSQWVIKQPGGWEVSAGLEFTLGLP